MLADFRHQVALQGKVLACMQEEVHWLTHSVPLSQWGGPRCSGKLRGGASVASKQTSTVGVPRIAFLIPPPPPPPPHRPSACIGLGLSCHQVNLA